MLKQFLKDEQGQTTVEYLLIIAVIVVVIATLGSKMQVKVGQLAEQIFGQMGGQVGKLMQKSGL
ncbi:MAG: Flp family type IVb pilin [Pseudomonadota bacterium]